VLQLSAGTHFMQVSKWLGHSTYTLTLDVYGDYIPEQDGGAAKHAPGATRARTARRGGREGRAVATADDLAARTGVALAASGPSRDSVVDL
jgi:hypothetical protein